MATSVHLEQSPVCPPQRSFDVSQHYAFFKERCLQLHLDSASERMELKLGFMSGSSIPFEITQNGFPYCGCYHYVLWINPRYDKFYTTDRILSILEGVLPQPEGWRVFKNLVINQTIPGITHYHFLHMKATKGFEPPNRAFVDLF